MSLLKEIIMSTEMFQDIKIFQLRSHIINLKFKITFIEYSRRHLLFRVKKPCNYHELMLLKRYIFQETLFKFDIKPLEGHGKEDERDY